MTTPQRDAIEHLNANVTRALFDAKHLPEGTHEARVAFAEASRIEAALAALTDADTAEGEAARLGAVSAALKANEPGRALRLRLDTPLERTTVCVGVQIDGKTVCTMNVPPNASKANAVMMARLLHDVRVALGNPREGEDAGPCYVESYKPGRILRLCSGVAPA